MPDKEKPVYISTDEAVEVLVERGLPPVSLDTIRYWCKKYNVGRKIGGRWKVDLKQFKAYLHLKD